MPMDNPYFPNGRVSVLSTKLISQEKFLRLADAGDLSSALKILYESGYGANTVLSSPNDYEKLLDRELTGVISFVTDMTSDNLATDCLLLPYDYLNAKLIVKGAKTGKDVSSMLNSYGIFSAQTVIDAVNTKKYGALPTFMAEALKQIDCLSEQNSLTPFDIDCILDKATYSHVLTCAKKCSHKVLADYFSVKIDMLNLISAYRCITLRLGKEYYQKTLLTGGTLSHQTLLSNFTDNAAKMTENYKRTNYNQLCATCLRAMEKGESLTISEVYTANYIKNILKPYNLANDKITPLVNYYFSKLTEIDNVRVILMCLKNNIDANQIKLRLKELYV